MGGGGQHRSRMKQGAASIRVGEEGGRGSGRERGRKAHRLMQGLTDESRRRGSKEAVGAYIVT
jgi:hypothetical protein